MTIREQIEAWPIAASAVLAALELGARTLRETE